MDWQNLRVVVLLVSSFLPYMVYSVITPIFPAAARKKGMTDGEIGSVFAVFQCVIAVFSPIYGSLISRLGPKFMCVAGAFLTGGCCILFGFTGSVENLMAFKVLCFAIRIVEGNGAVMAQVAAASVLMSTFPGSTGKISSAFEVSIGLGLVAGASVGSMLFFLGGYSLPFMVVGGATMTVGAILWCILPNTLSDSAAHPGSSFSLSLLKIPGFAIIFLQGLIGTFSITWSEPIYSTWIADEFGVQPAISGYILGGQALFYILAAPVIGFLVDKGHLYWMMIAGTLGLSVAFMFLPPSPLVALLFPHRQQTFGCAIFLTVIQGAFQGMAMVPTHQAAINLAVLHGYEPSTATYGMTSGLISMCMALGSLISPLLSGFLTQTYGFAWANTVGSFIILPVTITMFTYVSVMKRLGRPTAPARVAPGETETPLMEDVK